MREQSVGLEHRVHRPLMRRLVPEFVSVQQDAPGIGPYEPADGAQKRGLARAGTPEQHEHLAAPDSQLQRIERDGAAEADRQPLDCKEWRARHERQLPALKRAHMRLRARSAACGTGPIVKNDAMRSGWG